MADPNDGGATIESRQSKCKLLPAQVLRHHCATFSPQTIARIIPSFLLSPPELFPTQCDRKERERERGELRVYSLFGSMISSARCRFRSPFPKSKESKILCVLSRCVDVSEHTLFTSLSIYLTRKKIPEPTVCAPLATTEIFVFERILIDKLLRPGVANCDCCCWRDLTVDDFIFKTLRRARLAVGPTFM